jgi:hypothetical protein
MAFNASPAITGTLELSRYIAPASGVRTHFSTAVALDTDVSIGMADLAGLQIPARLS